MGLHAGAEKVLAHPDPAGHADPRGFDRDCAKLGRGTVHLHAFLGTGATGCEFSESLRSTTTALRRWSSTVTSWRQRRRNGSAARNTIRVSRVMLLRTACPKERLLSIRSIW